VSTVNLRLRAFEIDIIKARALAKIQDEEDRRLWALLEKCLVIWDEKEEA